MSRSEGAAQRVALSPFDDLRTKLALLHNAHEQWWAAGVRTDAVRSAVARSWRRSEHLGLTGSDVLALADVQLLRSASPELARAHEIIASRFSPLLDAMGVELVVCGADGRVLWTDGVGSVRRASERLGFVAGACWSEGAVGSNALGASLADGQALQFIGPEHREAGHHGWVCTAAPIYGSGAKTIGAFTLSGPLRTAHPHTLALVESLAYSVGRDLRIASAQHLAGLGCGFELAARELLVTSNGQCVKVGNALSTRFDTDDVVVSQAELTDGSRVWLRGLGFAQVSAEQGLFRLRLSSSEGVVVRPHPMGVDIGHDDGSQVCWQTVALEGRSRELMAILMESPTGVSGRELALRLYGDASATVTVRAEISRLRRKVGPLIASRPYRLTCSITA